MKQQPLSADELRSLRAYAAATAPIPIETDQRMFNRLFGKQLVVGCVAYDAKGDPFGAIKLTERGRKEIIA